jgi:hypothetical protein
MLYLRQLNLDWWIRSWDLQFHESRSYSVAKFGPNENISLIDYPINYHWFGLAWLGSLTAICDLAPWLSVAQVAPVYAALGIGGLILAISNLNSSRSVTKYLVLTSFAFASGTFSPANPPNIVSLIWVIAAIVVVSEFFKQQRVNTFLAFLIIAIAAFSSKVSAGYVLLTAFVLTDLWTQRQSLKNISLPIQSSASMKFAFFLKEGTDADATIHQSQTSGTLKCMLYVMRLMDMFTIGFYIVARMSVAHRNSLLPSIQ